MISKTTLSSNAASAGGLTSFRLRFQIDLPARTYPHIQAQQSQDRRHLVRQTQKPSDQI